MKSRLYGRNRIAVIFATLAIVIAISWYWYNFIFPVSEFQRLGDIRFPQGTHVIRSGSDGWKMKGAFQIPKAEFAKFKSENELSDAGYVAAEYFIGNKCIHNGENSVEIRLYKQTNVAEIDIGESDMAGDKPCKPN
jgi:hypothetical protein